MEQDDQAIRVEGVPVSHISRLTEIAQRLDELSDEGPTELAALAEEMGAAVEGLEQEFIRLTERPLQTGQILPEYLREIQSIVERRAEEVIYHRYGNSNPASPYITINIPNRGHYDAVAYDRLAGPVLDPKAISKIAGI